MSYDSNMEKPPTLKADIVGESVEKTYLYHKVSANMDGAVLHPLSTLKETHPELYVAHVAKYNGREHVMEQFIPTLGAKWNDVLHFTPIHPEELKKALVEAGMEPHETIGAPNIASDPTESKPRRIGPQTAGYSHVRLPRRCAPNQIGPWLASSSAAWWPAR